MRYPKQPSKPFNPAPRDINGYLETMEKFILETAKHLKELEQYIKVQTNNADESQMSVAEKLEADKNDYRRMIFEANERLNLLESQINDD